MKFLTNLLAGRLCTHRFSWPRIGRYGQHYQVCIRCGVAFAYDWDLMRRTERLGPEKLVNLVHS